MFETYKLNKYRNSFVGFAYDMSNKNICGRYIGYRNILEVYIVVLDHRNHYKFIKYRSYSGMYEGSIENVVDRLGAIPIRYYLNMQKDQEQEPIQKVLK